MSNRSVLQEILAAAARKMRADFESAAVIGHRGSKGTEREMQLLAFLQTYLPKTVQVAGSSEIISVDGQRSGQMDIVIYDPSAPPLFPGEAHRILPAECVYAVIEVKSKLTTNELLQSMDKIAKVKSLPKTAYYPWTRPERVKTMYGKEYVGHCPTAGFVFAYDSGDLFSMVEQYTHKLATQPYDQRLDAVWVLGIGAFNWATPSAQFVLVADPHAHVAVGNADPEQDILMNMMMVLNALLEAYSRASC